MSKIRKYQSGATLWTPNYNGIQSSFGKYGLLQSSLLGDFNSLNASNTFQLQPPSLTMQQNNPSALSGSKISNALISNMGNLNLNGIGNWGNSKLWGNNGLQSVAGKSATSATSSAAGSAASAGAAGAADTFKGGVSGMSSGLQSGLGAGAGLVGAIGAGMNDKLDSNVLQAREGVRGAISQMGPIGAIIGAATSVVDLIGDTTGLGLDSLDKNAAQRAGIKAGAVANNFIAAAPGVGLFAGLAAGKTTKGYKSDTSEEYRNAFSGSVADIDAAVELGGKRTLFGKRKANKFIRGANNKNRLITQIGEESNLRKSSTYGQELTSQNYNRYLGQSGGSNIVIGKTGMKIPALEEARKILENLKAADLPKTEDIEKFAEGGKMNVIAEGALHSRKNHLDEINENFTDVTPKGIPVVSLEEGGEITQHAEIEGGELVLTKELTSKLELLYQDGSEEAMIEAGRLLAEEIVENTDDKTNTILNDEDNN